MAIINKQTVDDIFNAAQVDEVVGDFVTLKKRGVNLLGLCPFHDEKTPSFTVSPAKGIYKCFGCGAGGNAVNFLMEHEHYTYPEALRWLANRYGIEIEETEMTPEMEQEQNEKESLFVVMNFAQEHFVQQLHESQEGKAVGLSYFKERGFTEDTIEKFKLGYCLEEWESFTKTAMDKGYKVEYLEKAGLTKVKDDRKYDGFRGRVMFPVHNLSGRVIAFGGRTLKSDKKTPKYINSPENEIYNKSRSLYGIFQAKKEIVASENCYLVEGYTDVISLHQVGIENVVASSGTSLTTEQIRLIKRYTNNITILYDGDTAGIKASFRGIDMILQQGMNVRVVQFPEGEDPDSYARKLDTEDFKEYISENAKDFIVFKTSVLATGTENDPIKKAKLIHEIVNSIALIPDHIARDLYVRQCSKLLEISEPALNSELNKARKNNVSKQKKEQDRENYRDDAPLIEEQEQHKNYKETSTAEFQERDVVRLLLNYAGKKIPVKEGEPEETSVANFIVQELIADNLTFHNEVYQQIASAFIKAHENGEELNKDFFTQNKNVVLSKVAIDLLSNKYELHDWERKELVVEGEDKKLRRAVLGAIRSLKTKKVNQMILQNQEELKTAKEKGIDPMELLKRQKILDEIKSKLSEPQGRIILN